MTDAHAPPTPIDWPTRDLLAHRVAATPERLALLDADTGETWTYRELDDRVATVANRLQRFTSATDPAIATLFGTRPASMVVAFAAMRLGAVLVPLHPRQTAAELRTPIERTAPDVLLCDRETAAVASEFAGELVPTVAAVEQTDAESVVALDSITGTPVEPDPLDRDRHVLTLFTSGTTGEPKGVRLTAGNLVASATHSAFRLGVTRGDRWLVCLPTAHMGGLAPLYRSTLYGTAVVLQRAFDPESTARVMRERDVTGVSLVPTMLTRLLDTGWSPPESLRTVLLGGAPASEELIDRCELADVPVHPTYGMTETASQIATATPEQAFAHPGTVGQPLVFTDVTVVNDEGAACEPGEPGELVVSGPTVSPGYLDDEQTAAAFGDRGLRTGDLGYRDEAGRLWILGRTDDAIQTGGELVHPAEVADVLRHHPAVTEAAIVGLPDAEWGERVGALVVLDDAVAPEGERDVDADELDGHCRSHLADYKVPKFWGFTDELPRTASGTVDRDAVREYLEP